MDTPLLKAALHEAVLNDNTRLKKELKEKAMELEAIKQQS
jgi:AAA+ superfamily predicted ATPase